MQNRLLHHIKTLLLPCVTFSVAVGFLSAIFVTAFKLAAERVIHLSVSIYDAVRGNALLIPLLLLGAALIGLLSSFILSKSHVCRGGGIPTSITAIRGIVRFRWIASVFVLPFAALLSFLCGVPLGTEGPCVQMGTAIGNGVVSRLGSKKHQGWRRYIMTGGASAGFSLATSCPITAIIFSMEELHKHFSPMLLAVASISVMTADFTAQMLEGLGIGAGALFHIPEIQAIAPKLLFAPLLIGLISGGCSILFTRLYYFVDKAMHAVLKRVSARIVFPILFVCLAVVGLFLSDALGTGHSLVDALLEGHAAWYMILLVFVVRAIGMTVSNTAGVTGGVFLPTLAFGAMIGSLCAEIMVALGWIAPEHYILMVILGISSFLGATSRIPVTACIFAVEAMHGIHNALAIIIATTVALLVAEASGLEDFTDTVIEAKLRSMKKGKKPTVIEVSLTAARDSFAIGKEVRDILWPNSCVVVSFKRASGHHGTRGIDEGDVITVHYKTYDPAATAEELRALMGEQSERVERIMIPTA